MKVGVSQGVATNGITMEGRARFSCFLKKRLLTVARKANNTVHVALDGSKYEIREEKNIGGNGIIG